MKATVARQLRHWAQRLDPQPSTTVRSDGSLLVDLSCEKGSAIFTLSLFNWHRPEWGGHIATKFNDDTPVNYYDLNASEERSKP